MGQHGGAIEKTAIVGAAAWRDQVYAFTGQGLRPTAIAYFAPSRRGRAEAWLAAA